MSETVSSEFGAFSIIPKNVLFSDISANAVRVYCILYHYSTMPLGALPSRATIGQQMGGVSRDTVDRAMKELVEREFLEITHRWVHPDKSVRDYAADGAEPTTSHYHLGGGRKDAHTLAAPVPIPSRKDAAHSKTEGNENEMNDQIRGFDVSKLQEGQYVEGKGFFTRGEFAPYPF